MVGAKGFLEILLSIMEMTVENLGKQALERRNVTSLAWNYELQIDENVANYVRIFLNNIYSCHIFSVLLHI
jgi:hypothetical protein